MSQFAALFERPTRVRAGYVEEPGAPGHVVLYHPCVGCWEEKELVGAIVNARRQVLIHIDDAQDRCSPAYYCAACWARDVEPSIQAFERTASVTLAASPEAGASQGAAEAEGA